MTWAAPSANHAPSSRTRHTRTQRVLARAFGLSLLGPRTSQLLLDIPRFELDAPVQVQPESRGDEERFDDRDCRGIGNGRDELNLPLAIGIEDRGEIGFHAFRCEPAEERQHPEHECCLDEIERARNDEARARLTRANLSNAFTQASASESFELVYGRRERTPGRQAALCPRADQLRPPDVSLRGPHVS